MSDYFGALMRSSGLAVGGAMPVPVPVPVPAPAELLEIDVERSVPALQQPPALAAQYQTRPLSPAAASSEPQAGGKPEAPAAQPLPIGVDTTVAVDRQQDKTGHKDALPTSTQPPQQATSPASPTDHRAPAAQPLGHDVMRAVMHWVAADPQQTVSASPSEIPHAPPAALDVADAPVVREPMPTADAEPHAILPMQTLTPKRGATRSVEAGEDAPRPATAIPVQAAFAHTPLPRDELVEISIGAIHLRVDAPATQALARAPAPPAAVPGSRAAAITPRSALARRALRRI